MMIRNARLDDLQAIVEIEQENFSDMAASLETMKERPLTIPDTFLVAEIDGAVAGYIEGSVVPQRYLTDDLFHQVEKNLVSGRFFAVTSLSVSSRFQGQGVGTALLATMKDLAIAQKRMGISLTCQENLISYYEMNGFLDEGESESQHDGAVWYNMVWESSMIG